MKYDMYASQVGQYPGGGMGMGGGGGMYPSLAPPNAVATGGFGYPGGAPMMGGAPPPMPMPMQPLALSLVGQSFLTNGEAQAFDAQSFTSEFARGGCKCDACRKKAKAEARRRSKSASSRKSSKRRHKKKSFLAFLLCV